MRFLNASVLPRKALNRNLSWGFPLGKLLPKTRVSKHRVLEHKRRPNANASVLGTQRFRTLRNKTLSEREGHFWSNSQNSRAFSEQLSEVLLRPPSHTKPILGAILGATPGIGGEPKWLTSAQILGAFFVVQSGVIPANRKTAGNYCKEGLRSDVCIRVVRSLPTWQQDFRQEAGYGKERGGQNVSCKFGEGNVP